MAETGQQEPLQETEKKIEEVRLRFKNEFVQDSSDKYDSRDVDRLQKDDALIEGYLTWRPFVVDDALKMIDESFQWRKEYGLNDLSESNIPKWMFETGAVYLHGYDKEGNKLFWFKVKLHTKDAKTIVDKKRYVAFWLERYAKREPGMPLTIVIDMSESGISNIDLEFISCFKVYYPTFFFSAKMIIVDMPWFMNAVWNTVKTWLDPDTISKLKFASKSDVQMYIDPEHLPPHMGGTDPFKYSYPPLPDDDFQTPVCENGPVISEDDNESKDGESLDSSYSSEVAVKPRKSTGHSQRPEGSDEGGSVLFFSNTLMSDIEADWSPILDAAYNGHVLALRNLIAQGTCVNTATLDRVSPLFGACLLGHSTCAKLLLDNGANVNSPTLGQTTALSEASARGHTACVTLLLQNGASPQGSAYSDSPIHQAAAKGHLKCIEILVHHGADVDQHIDQSGSPLHTACTNQHLSTVRTLLQLGASVNGSQDRESPLHAAARLSNAELVSVLLEHGADRSSRDARGRRAADLAPNDSPAERLLRHSGGVPCLMKLCRLLIRKVLGKKRLCEISGLHIPLELKLYLQYQSNQWDTCRVCPPIPKQYNFSPIGGALASPVEKSSEP